MATVDRSEFYLKTPDTGETLYLQRWLCPGPADYTLLITHGIAEHSECYHRTAEALAQHRIQVYAWDLPGHGRSYGQRGYISSFREFTDRLNFVVEEVHKLNVDAAPLLLFGHSMGGLITVQYSLKNSNAQNVKAMFLSSPAMGLKLKVSPLKDQASRLLAKIAPKLTLSNEIIYEDLSRDAELVKTYYKDPLRHTKVSAPLYLGILDAMADSFERAHQIRWPTLMQLAGDDRVTDTLAAQEFFQRMGSEKKKLKIYPESFHEIYNDINKQEVINDLLNSLRDLTYA